MSSFSIVLFKIVSFVIRTFEVLKVPKFVVGVSEIVFGVVSSVLGDFGSVSSVVGLLEFATVSAVVISFDFKQLFSMILSRVEKS